MDINHITSGKHLEEQLNTLFLGAKCPVHNSEINVIVTRVELEGNNPAFRITLSIRDACCQEAENEVQRVRREAQL